MIKSKIYQYILINLLINLGLFICFYYVGLQYCEYRKQEVIDSISSQIYEEISYHLAMPDYVEIQREINAINRPEISGIIVLDNFDKTLWSNDTKHGLSGDDATHDILFDGRKVGVLGITLNSHHFNSILKKMALTMAAIHFPLFILSIFITVRIHAKKIEELEWQKAISERRLEIVGKIAACITHQLEGPVMAMEKNFANSRYAKTIKKIQKYIYRIQQVAIGVSDEDAKDIEDFVDVTITAGERVDKMREGTVVIPISSGKYLKKRI